MPFAGGKMDRNKMAAVAWQRYLPVTIILSSSLPSHEEDPNQTTPTPHTFSASAKQLDLTHPGSRHHMKWGL